MKPQTSLAIATLIIALGFILFFNQAKKEAAIDSVNIYLLL